MQDGDHVDHVLAQWQRELPELDRTAFAVVGRISRLAVLLQGQLEPVFAVHGLTGAEFDVLAALRRAGRPYRLTPGDLSRALIVTSGGLTPRLQALEKRGLIRREPDPDDGRSIPVVLTRSGKQLVEGVLTEHIRNEDRLISRLGDDERNQLAVLLRALALALGDVSPRLAGKRLRRAKADQRAASASPG
jgi:DNA-binding MarR family transcriptional regulator